MIKKTTKKLWLLALVLMAIISLTGIVACGGGADITGSGSSNSPSEPGETGPIDTGADVDNDTTTTITSNLPIFEKNRVWTNEYYKIYVPFAGYKDDSVIVSYKDQAKLQQIWREQITRNGYNNRKGYKDGKVFFIKNGKNNKSQDSFKNGNDYFYFDDDLNIYHKSHPNQRLQNFVGAVIIQYALGKYKGTYSIGGIYEIAGRRNTQPYSELNDYGIDIFLGRRHAGTIEILVINAGITRNEDSQNYLKNEYGVDKYLSTRSQWYGVDYEYVKSVMPEDIMQNMDSKISLLDRADGGEYRYSFVVGDKE